MREARGPAGSGAQGWGRNRYTREAEPRYVRGFESELKSGGAAPLLGGRSLGRLKRSTRSDPAFDVVDAAIATKAVELGERSRIRGRPCKRFRYSGDPDLLVGRRTAAIAIFYTQKPEGTAVNAPVLTTGCYTPGLKLSIHRVMFRKG